MATDLTSLQIKVDTTEVNKASDDLNNLKNKASQAQSQANKDIKPNVDTTKVKQAQKDMEGLGKSVKGTVSDFFSLQNIIGAISLYQLTTSLVANSDAWTNLNNKLRLVTNTAKDLKVVQEELFAISQATRTDLTSSAELYRKLAVSTESLNVSQERLLKITETINKTGLIGGGSADSINAGLTQLGQGLAAGALRGEELNSVLEQTPRLAKLIADGMGVAVGDLKGLAEQGLITTEQIINAVEGQAEAVNKEFATMNATIEQSMTTVKNSILLAVGTLDEGTGASKAIADSFISLSKTLDENADDLVDYVSTLGTLVATAGVLVTTYKASNVVMKVYNSLLATSAVNTGKLTTAMKAQAVMSGTLSAAMRAIPHVALATGVFLLVDSFVSAGDKADVLSESLKKLREETKNLTQEQLNNKKADYTLQLEEQTKKLKEQQKVAEELAKSGRISNYGFSESDRANIDVISTKNEIEETKALLAELVKIEEELKTVKESTSEDGGSGSGGATKKLSKDLEQMLYPLDVINKKYDLYIEQLKKTADYNETNVNKINELRQKEIDSLNQKIIKEQEVKEVQLSILEEYYLTQQDYQTAWLVKSSELNAQLVGLEEQQAQTLLEKWKTEYFDKINELRSNEEIQQIETNFDGLNEALDAQIALIETSEQWGNTLGGVAGDILNIVGAYKNVEKVSLKYQKEQLKADEKLAKVRAKYGDDSLEAIDAEIDHHKESTKIKEQEQQSEIDGFANIAGAYGSMAGSIASMAEQGSTAAKVATVAQQALAIASGVAAIMQQGMGDPYTAFARIAAMTALVVSTLSSFGVSSSGGATESVPSAAELEAEAIKVREEAEAQAFEFNDEAMVNRLDQQIELLEAIERNGSAQALSIDLARAEFQQSINEWSQAVFDASITGWVQTGVSGEAGQTRADAITAWENALGGNVFDFRNDGSEIKIDTTSLRNNPQLLISALNDILTGELGYSTPLGQGIYEDVGYGVEGHEAFNAQLNMLFSEMQGYINEWATSVIGTISEMADSADTMKELYDSLTGTDFYASQKLTQAFKDFDSLLSGGQSYTDYLVKNIDSIEKSSKFIYEMSGVLDENGQELSNYELLLSKNGDLIEEQIALVDKFGVTAGTVFEGGVEEALNYLDSIELVTEALATSRENINDFYEGFRSQEQSLGVLAEGLGVSIPQTAEQYFKLFESMSSDLEGLTDDELAFLEASKDYISSKNEEIAQAQQDSVQAQIDGYNELTAEVETNIKTLNTIISSITSTVDKLRGSSTGGVYTLEQFNKALELAESLSGGEDYEALSEAIKDVSSYSSALSDSDLFTSDREMAYAQSVAANRLEGIESTSLTQIDYLQQIADNTKATVDALLAQLEKLGASITDSNDSLQEWFDKNYPDGGTVTTPSGSKELTASEQAVNQAFNQVLGRDAQSEGLKYWSGKLDSGSISESDLATQVALGASTYTDIQSALSYLQKNGILQGQSLLDKAYNYGYISDNEANSLLDTFGIKGITTSSSDKDLAYNVFKALFADKIVPFAKGGIVTAPTVGLIGEAGYNEAVIPLNGQDHLGIGALTRKIDNQNAIIAQQNNLIREQNLYLKDIRDIDNSSYLKLETIGDRI